MSAPSKHPSPEALRALKRQDVMANTLASWIVAGITTGIVRLLDGPWWAAVGFGLVIVWGKGKR